MYFETLNQRISYVLGIPVAEVVSHCFLLYVVSSLIRDCAGLEIKVLFVWY